MCVAAWTGPHNTTATQKPDGTLVCLSREFLIVYLSLYTPNERKKYMNIYIYICISRCALISLNQWNSCNAQQEKWSSWSTIKLRKMSTLHFVPCEKFQMLIHLFLCTVFSFIDIFILVIFCSLIVKLYCGKIKIHFTGNEYKPNWICFFSIFNFLFSIRFMFMQPFFAYSFILGQ